MQKSYLNVETWALAAWGVVALLHGFSYMVQI